MPDAKFSLFSIGVPDWLILRARTTANPGAEVGNRDVLGPAPVGTLNFLLTELPPENCFIDLYESVDGVVLTALLGTFTYDVKTQKITEELRFYVVGSGINNSPADSDTTLTDSYLDGKTVTAFEKRSIGSLVPVGLGLGAEWDIAGTVITLQSGMPAFAEQETYVAHISYNQPVDTTQNPGFFKGIKTITTNTTFDGTYRNCRIRCNGSGPRLVATMEDGGSVPNGTFWYFVDQNGGAQFQAKINLTSGNFLYNGVSFPEVWIGKGDCIWIEYNDGVFEIIQPSDVLRNVGKRSAETGLNFANLFPEDFSLWNADDLPALWYWITHDYPNANYYIVDDNLDNVGYTKPMNLGLPYKTGLFIISTTKRKFRMPDTRNLVEKGSKDFTTFGADTTRAYDYPGGFQQEAEPEHSHIMHGTGDALHPGTAIPGSGGPFWLTNDHPGYTTGPGQNSLGGNASGPDSNLRTGPAGTAGVDAAVKNFSVIYYRHA